MGENGIHRHSLRWANLSFCSFDFRRNTSRLYLWCSPWDIDVWDPGILEKDYFGCEAELWQILQFDGGDGDDGDDGGDDDDDGDGEYDSDGDGDKRSGYNLVEPWHILQYQMIYYILHFQPFTFLVNWVFVVFLRNSSLDPQDDIL